MAYDIYNDMNVVAELPWNKILVKWNKTPIDKWVYISQQLQKVSANKYSSASPASIPKNTSKYTRASPASIPVKSPKPLGNIASMTSPTWILGNIAWTSKPKLDLTQDTSKMQPNMSMTPKKPIQVLWKSTSTGWWLISTASADYSWMNLFKDEVEAYSKMKEDWLSDEEANNLIKDRRKDLMWGNTKLSQEESRALLKMQQDWLNADEAVKMLDEYRTNKPKEEPKKTSIAREIFNIPVWAAALATEQVWNILDFVTMWKFWFWEDVAKVKEVNKYLEDSTWANIWRNILWTWEMLAVWPTKLAKTLWWRALQWAWVWAVTWAWMPILEKGSETTKWDIITWWLIWGAIWWLASPVLEKAVIPATTWIVNKTIKYGTAWIKWWVQWLWKSISRDISKIWKATSESVSTPLTRTIPEAVVKRDLWFTPTERANIEKITGKTESQYILDKWLAGKGKEELASIFDKQASDMYNGINTQLKNIQAPPVKSKEATLALQDIIEQLSSKPKLANAYAKDINRANDLLQKWEYTPLELNNIRRAYDKVNTGMYTAKWEMKSWVENRIDIEVRNWIKNTLEKEAKKYWIDIKEMNKELRAWLELKDALLRRLSQEERNNFIWLQDLWVSAILSWWEPISAIATIWAKKYAEKVAPWISQKLYNLNKKPNVSSRLNRGNTITPASKSSRLGLVNNPRPNMAKPPVNTNVTSKKSVLSDKEKELIINPLWKAKKK